MDLNSVIFPAPSCSYSFEDLQGELVWIPKLSPSSLETFRETVLLSECESDPFPKTPVPLSYNNRLQEAKHNLAVSDSIAKPEIKEPELDDMDMSFFTTSSTRCSPAVETLLFKGESSKILQPKSVSNENCQKITSKNFSNQSKLAFNSPKTIQNDLLDFVNVSVSCIEEQVSHSLPISETNIRMPCSYKEKEKLHQMESDEAVSSLKVKNNSGGVSFDNVPGKHLPHSFQNNYAKGLINFTPQKLIENELELMGHDDAIKIAGLKPNSKQQAYNKGVCAFSSDVFDEMIETRRMGSPMQKITNYFSRYDLKPSNEMCAGGNKNQEDSLLDLVTDYVEEEEDAFLTNCKDVEQYAITPLLFQEKTQELSKAMLTPSPHKRSFTNETASCRASTQQSYAKNTTEHKQLVMGYIPCRLLYALLTTRKIMIYFHGNGEDIYQSSRFLFHIRKNMNINVLAVEFPGYGLYKGTATEEQILEDAEFIYDFLVTVLRIDPNDILLCGRSIGSGPATYLASKKKVGALVLMAAFTSIRSVVKDLAGPLARFLIKERFNNIEAISKVYCPTFIVHGQRDKLIPYQHSQYLHNACKGPSELLLPKTMDHSEFNFYEDFSTPLIQFLDRIGFEWDFDEALPQKIYFPEQLFKLPESLKPQFEKSQLEKDKIKLTI